jgi:hypothetical protein
MSRQVFCEQAIEVVDDIVLYVMEGKKVDAGLASERLANLAEAEFVPGPVLGMVQVRGNLDSVNTPSKMHKDIQLKVSVSNSLENRELLARMGMGVNVVGQQLDLECAVGVSEPVEDPNQLRLEEVTCDALQG